MAPADINETLTSEPEAVRRVLDDVRDHISDAPGFAAVSDMSQIVLGEILNNVVEHAYRMEPGHPIQLSITFEDGGLHCRVIDDGVAMPNGTPPNGGMPELDPSQRDELPEGGFGWALVRDMTEQLIYSRRNGQNHLEFSIPQPES